MRTIRIKSRFVSLLAISQAIALSALLHSSLPAVSGATEVGSCASNMSELQQTVTALCAPGKGILVRRAGPRQCGRRPPRARTHAHQAQQTW